MAFNYLNIVQAIRNGQNPQQLVLSFLEGQFGNTPLGQNLLILAKENRTKDIEKIARNMCAERGLDFDKEFDAFKKKIGLDNPN